MFGRVLLLLTAVATLMSAPVYMLLLKGSGAVAWYTPDGKLLASVPVGEHPHEMVFSADRKVLYTTDNGIMRIEQAGRGGNTVSIIDVASRRKLGVIFLGDNYRPHGIDLDPKTGRLVVTSEMPDGL